MARPLKIKILYPAILIFLIACNNTYTPKPAGYPKIEFPEKAYKPYVSDAPYSFEIPVYSYVEDELKNNPESNADKKAIVLRGRSNLIGSFSILHRFSC